MANGWPVTVWARRVASVDALDCAVAVADSLDELGASCDVVAVCVTADADVESVVNGGLLDAMASGTTLIIHSTISPETCHRISDAAGSRGVAVIDAPVSRDRADHDTARYSLLLGGDASDIDRVSSVMDAYAEWQFHLGPVGSGMIMKIINNTMSAANLRIIYDALDAGENLGLDPDAMADALRHTSGGSVMVGFAPVRKAPMRTFNVAVLAKDVALFGALTDQSTAGDSTLARASVDILGQLQED